MEFVWSHNEGVTHEIPWGTRVRVHHRSLFIINTLGRKLMLIPSIRIRRRVKESHVDGISVGSCSVHLASTVTSVDAGFLPRCIRKRRRILMWKRSLASLRNKARLDVSPPCPLVGRKECGRDCIKRGQERVRGRALFRFLSSFLPDDLSSLTSERSSRLSRFLSVIDSVKYRSKYHAIPRDRICSSTFVYGHVLKDQGDRSVMKRIKTCTRATSWKIQSVPRLWGSAVFPRWLTDACLIIGYYG